tara:strand:- start:823 stop:1488 length:666 start_codon:yes stop_codon:yes gene_type:complete
MLNTIIDLKVGLFGDSDVGKSTLLYYLQTNTILEQKSTTIGVDYASKEYEHQFKNSNDKLIVKYQIWDTAGQERYNSIISKYYSVHIPIFMFDISDKNSFNNLNKWINNYNQNSRYKPIKKYCIGNKIDLQNKIDEKDIEDLCYKNNMIYFENSNTIKNNINSIFNMITNDMATLYNNNYNWCDSVKINKYNKKNKIQKLIVLDVNKNYDNNLFNKLNCCY